MTTFNLPKLLANYEFNKTLPKAPYWWGDTALASGEAYKIIGPLVSSLGNLLAGVKQAQADGFITLASTNGLDQWGTDLQIPRNTSEDDEPYRQRLLKEIVRSRGTKEAIEGFVTDLTGYNTTVFEPWRFLHRPSYRDTSLAWGVPDPVNGRSGKTRRSSTYWQAGTIDIITDGYSPRVRIETADIIAASIYAYYTNLATVDVIQPDDNNAAVTNDEQLQYNIYVPFSSGKRVLSGNQQRRSGRITLFSDFIKVIEMAPVVLLDVLFDTPNTRGPFTVYDTAQTWESLELYTWDQAIVGHSGEPAFEILNKINLVELPILSLDSLIDHPSFKAPTSVFDTAQTWESLEDYTWSDAIDPGHSAEPSPFWTPNSTVGSDTELNIDSSQLLWDYSDGPTYSVFDTSFSWVSLENQTWDEATIRTDGIAPTEAGQIDRGLTYTPLTNGSMESVDGSQVPTNWSILAATPNATTAFRGSLDKTSNTLGIPYVSDGNLAQEFYVVSPAYTPSENSYRLSTSINPTTNHYLVFDVTTGSMTSSDTTYPLTNSYSTPAVPFGYVKLTITNAMGEQDLLWGTTLEGQQYRDIAVDLTPYQDGMPHTITFVVGVGANVATSCFAHATVDNVRYGN